MFRTCHACYDNCYKPFLGEAKAGMFSIGLSIAQWLVTIAYFEIRTYQVTDVKNEYPLDIISL